MSIELIFFLEVLAGGLLAGVMYSLVALGFVLIYKASGVFNFAQGAMVFFAALTYVSLVERGWNFWLALLVTFLVMIALGIATERVVLRPLVNQPQITLFMATIGLTFVLEGLSQLIWGSQPHGLELGIPDVPMEWLSQKWNVNISQFDVFAALVAGLMWGVRNGVQFALTFVALKALPVLILGGFESIAGAIVGGLIIGATEKLAEVYIGPFFGGGIESWFAYVVALLFLLVRPEGLFGEKIIDRV